MNKPIIAIQEDNLPLTSGRYQSFSTRWHELASQQGIATRKIDIYSNSENYFEQLDGCDALMWWFGQPLPISRPGRRVIASLAHVSEIPTFPNLNTIWHFDDKVAQYYLLSAARVPIPETWVLWGRRHAEKFIVSAKYPLVLKLASGIVSENVELVRNVQCAAICQRPSWRWDARFAPPSLPFRWFLGRCREARRILFSEQNNSEFNKGFLLFQEFLPGNDFDIRITVIGNRAFAFRRYNRPNDFRASGSGRIDWDPDQIPEDAILLAFETARILQTQSLAIDVLRRDGAPVIAEISYYYEGWAIAACPGHWKLYDDSQQLVWVAAPMRAEDAIWEDFVSRLGILEE
jgi:glutathione synthase/RimK-type ligase-like ATP-grasp enzyme